MCYLINKNIYLTFLNKHILKQTVNYVSQIYDGILGW